jgi:GT2 family glycosyltransferase
MVSIIVPTTTGGLSHLSKLMPPLSQENGEIIIVDNNSRDGTTNYLSNYDCLLKINKNKMSFSQSNNFGATKASGEYLLFLNNDTIPVVGFSKEMVNVFNIDPKIAVVGCKLITMDNPKKLQHAGVMFTKNYIPYELGLPQPEITEGILPNDPRAIGIREVPSITAACMMIKKSVFDEVGGFDEKYVFGWEDTDLCLKVRERGYKIWYTGKAIVAHLKFGSKDRGRFAYENENRKLYDDVWVHTGRAKKILGNFREA